MKKRKLKKYVLPTVFLSTIGVICLCLTVIAGNVSGDITEYDYVTGGLINNAWPVFNDNETQIIKPYIGENVNIKAHYYNKDSESSKQIESLIYYENTYMPNTGILYVATDKFEVVNVLSGTVSKITKDEILGNIITINHGNNVSTIYYSVDEIAVSENQVIEQNTILGKSTKNKISNDSESLLFEVNINGSLVDPEVFYSMDINSIIN